MLSNDTAAPAPIGKYEEYVHTFYENYDRSQYDGGKEQEPMDMEQMMRAPKAKRAPVKKWSPAEDDVLREGITVYLRNEQPIDYDEIVRKLPGRSVKQAKERWKNSLNPKIKKGEWSEEEIITLLDLIIAKGQNWTHIQKVLVHRSMHCIKSKGRKLLGETVNKKLSKASKIKGVRKEWFPDEQERLLELHQVHGSDIDAICLALRTGRPTAQADRKLLTMCNCPTCSARYRELTATGDDFKLAWTQAKARQVKQVLLADGVTAQSRHCSSKPAYASVETKNNFSMENNNNNNTIQHEQQSSLLAPVFGSSNTFGLAPEDVGYNNFLEPEQKMGVPPVQANDSNTLRRYDTPLGPPVPSTSTALVSSTPSRRSKRLQEDDESEDFTNEEAIMKRSKTTKDFLDRLDEALGVDFDLNGLEDGLDLDLSMLGDLTEKQQQDHVLALIKQTAQRAEQSRSRLKLSQNIARFFADYFSPDDLQTWSGTFQEQGIEFFNPSICYVLDSITPNSADPRYQKSYLSPESNEVTFDMFRPVGTIIVNLATRVFTDVDKPAVLISRGSMRGKHSWHFVPSRVEALLRVYYMMPRLLRTGEAWSHVRMHRCDGSEGVFLCRYTLMNNGEDAMIKFQDVSARFQDVLELPPDLW